MGKRAYREIPAYRYVEYSSIMYIQTTRTINIQLIKGANDIVLHNEQAGFREKRNCVEQVPALTTHIETGLEKNLKTALALVDLIWRMG